MLSAKVWKFSRKQKARGKLAPNSGTFLDFLFGDRRSLLEFFLDKNAKLPRMQEVVGGTVAFPCERASPP